MALTLTGRGRLRQFPYVEQSLRENKRFGRRPIMPAATQAPAPPVRAALLVRLEAKPGKEAAVASFLEDGLPIVEQEPATITWYAIKLGPSTFGIFDTFPDDSGRQAHLSGQVAVALMENVGKLFGEPTIEQVDILAAKLPG